MNKKDKINKIIAILKLILLLGVVIAIPLYFKRICLEASKVSAM